MEETARYTAISFGNDITFEYKHPPEPEDEPEDEDDYEDDLLDYQRNMIDALENQYVENLLGIIGEGDSDTDDAAEELAAMMREEAHRFEPLPE